MPVPKKRVGRSDQAHRRANWKAILPTGTTCSHCGNVKLSHVLCTNCGYHKGRIVSEKLHAHHEH